MTPDSPMDGRAHTPFDAPPRRPLGVPAPAAGGLNGGSAGRSGPASRLALPPVLAWLHDEAALRPPVVARVLGVPLEQLSRWTAGIWTPAPVDVPLLAAVGALGATVAEVLPEVDARRRWWSTGQRELGWLSPAELLRRGKLGEVLLLAAALQRDGASDV